MRLSTFDAVRRGLANLRGNAELVGVQFAQTVVTLLFVFGGLLLPVLAIGAANLEDLAVLAQLETAEPEEVLGLFAGLLEAVSANPGRLAAALVGTLIVWTVGLVVWSYFQAGIYAVLAEGDRQAPPGRMPADVFRTFGWRAFHAAGARHTWRFFWLTHVVLTAVLLAWALMLGAVLLAANSLEGSNPQAMILLGCGAALPFLLLLLLSACWVYLAYADAARPESGVWKAAGNGWKVLGERLGAVVSLFVLIVAVALAFGLVFGLGNVVVGLLVAESAVLSMAFQIVSMFVQWFVNAVMTVAAAAIFIALVRSEAARRAEA